MKARHLYAAVVLMFASLFAVFAYPTRYMYEDMKSGTSTLHIRMDRLSDRTWRLTLDGWREQRTEKVAQIPTKGITGHCSPPASTPGNIQYTVFCDISNETDFTLHTVTVRFSEGKISCVADLSGIVPPHTLGTMIVKPPCAYGLTDPFATVYGGRMDPIPPTTSDFVPKPTVTFSIADIQKVNRASAGSVPDSPREYFQWTIVAATGSNQTH